MLTLSAVWFVFLYFVTACFEIGGCYLFYLFWSKKLGAWSGAASLAVLIGYAWLLTLQPSEAGRTYASYGGVYVTMAVVWLWQVEGVVPDRYDLLGVGLALSGMLVIRFAPHTL